MYELRPYQEEAVSVMLDTEVGDPTLIVLPTGCHAKGTKILMFDGNLKAVEEIIIGDQLMGPDSKPRNVLELHSGVDDMYKIIPKKGESFVVNKGHILSLKTTNQGLKYPCELGGEINNIAVSEYIHKRKWFKHINKLYRTDVRYSEKVLILDPYLLGLLLGDGSICNRQLNICSPDIEIENEIYRYAHIYRLGVRKEEQPNNKSYVYHFIYQERKNYKHHTNQIRESLKQLNLYGTKSDTKFIPHIYKTSSREQRLELLAGLVDTDGHYDGKGIEYITKSSQLRDDVLYLVRSLGLAAYTSEKPVNGVIYHRITISGELSIIPTRVKRKQANKRKQKKDVLVTGFDIEYVGIDNYFGFTVDQNNLYVMGNFTVTHNSGKTVCFAKVVSQIRGRVLIITPSTELRKQAIDKIHRLDPTIDIGSVQGQKHRDFSNKVVVCTRQSLSHKSGGPKRIKELLTYGNFEMVIIDENHEAMGQYKKILKWLNPDVKICGLTATPWNKEMVAFYKKIKYSKTIIEMIIQDYLVDPICFQVNTETDLSSVGMDYANGDFKVNELDEAIVNEERNEVIVKAYKDYASGRLSTLIFANTKAHIKSIVKTFTDHGIDCEGLDSDTHKDYRTELIEKFMNGKLPVLVNCGVLTTGFDYERLDCLILARPTRSKILYAQCLGRGLRIHEEKENCLVIDIVDIARQHDICDISTIFEMKIKNGDTYKKTKEKIEEEQAMLEEEEAKKEEEKRKVEELKLQVNQINLFNTEMAKAFGNSEYDWWKVDITAQALTFKSNQHYVIESINNTYNLYLITTEKENRTIKHIKESTDLDGIVFYVEDQLLSLIWNRNSFAEKDSDFKLKPATPAQLSYCKHARTHWDVQKHFGAYQIKNLIKEQKIYQVI